jgi:gas vesicle protein
MAAGATSGAVSGAASGASAGAAVGGPWGALIGGVIGGIGGLFSGKNADKAAKNNRRAIRAAYQQKYKQLEMQRRQTLGLQTVGYAAAGVDVGTGTPELLLDTTQRQFQEQQAFQTQNENYALKGATPQTDWWGLGLQAVQTGANIYSGMDQKVSPYSQGGANANNPINAGLNAGERQS